MQNLGNRTSQHNFSQIPAVNMARSQFDRSFTIKDTLFFDYLNPIFVDEIIPKDTANVHVNAFARLATQQVPIMDNMYLDFFFFFVPNRLIWTNWEKFCGAQTNPGDSTDFLVPTLTTTAVTGEVAGSVADKFGIPVNVPGLVVNALPWRAMYKIYNDWFRDENLQNSLTLSIDDGPDLPSEYVLLKRGKRHDYFTSALPWPQKGTAISMPLGTSAPVKGTATGTAIELAQVGTPTKLQGFRFASATPAWRETANRTFDNLSVGMFSSANQDLYADLSTATAATINQLRQAWQVQSLLELDARGGTRYVEILLAHYNVVSPDFRLQRSEYLGGGTTRINSHPVAQTSPTSGSNYQAQLTSFATATVAKDSIGFTKSFVEHGYVLGFMCARGDITYQQGLERMWSKSTRYDFFWPKLQEIREQTILNKELYAQGSGNPTQDAAAFGYAERYAEYRYKASQIRGVFRSQVTPNIDQWHLAEEFGGLPSLNATFITQTTPIARALSNPLEAHLLFDCFFKYLHARPMLSYSVPATLGKF